MKAVCPNLSIVCLKKITQDSSFNACYIIWNGPHMRLNHSLMILNCHKFPDSRDRASSANGDTSTFEKMPSYFTLKSCGPFITIAHFHAGCKIHVSHKWTFFCLLSTQSLLEPKWWILMLKPNFLVAYSSVSFSTHIRMLLELSSFANEFSFSPSLSCWTGSCTGAGQSKTGRRAEKSVKFHSDSIWLCSKADIFLK